jgi:hypothetical protein
MRVCRNGKGQETQERTTREKRRMKGGLGFRPKIMGIFER